MLEDRYLATDEGTDIRDIYQSVYCWPVKPVKFIKFNSILTSITLTLIGNAIVHDELQRIT